MNNSASQDLAPLYDEVAIADFNQFQIAVLTAARMVERQILSAKVPVPERLYQSQGWLISQQKIVAHFDKLKVGLVFSQNSPFRAIRRLSPAVPTSFEVRSSQPLPAQICSQATVICELPEADFPHHTVFRKITPRFVRLYPFETNNSLLEKVDAMLADEASFLAKNYQRLQHVPFYQKRFDLKRTRL